MLFNSISFLIYFPIVVLVYFVLPDKIKNPWLLVSSYYFYMSWNVEYGLLILLSTVITYLSGIFIDKFKKEILRKFIFAASLISNLGILIFFKYFNWLLDNINQVTGHGYSIPFDIVLPVGISFYTFQALGYTFDVYREKIRAEKNFITYALYVSFFPQLVAGPIERSTNLIKQLQKPKKFNTDNATKGFQIMLWGYVEKMVIADNLAILVDQVYRNYTEYSGSVLLFATILCCIQIYCDFGGYSHIAIGAAKVLNVTLMENFRQPYFAKSFKDRWTRWHISMSGWFRDYLYIPLGGGRCSKFRKNINIMITFIFSGLWHGASWHYVAWGAIEGGFQVIGDIIAPIKSKIYKKLSINTKNKFFSLGQIGLTFFLTNIAVIMFRATSITEALHIYKTMLLDWNMSSIFDGTILNIGLNMAQYIVTGIAIVLLLFVDVTHERNRHLTTWINSKPRVVRWGIYYALVLLILLSVLQTFGKSAASFIYFQF